MRPDPDNPRSRREKPRRRKAAFLAASTEIRRSARSRFDPVVVDAFFAVIDSMAGKSASLNATPRPTAASQI